MQPIKYVTDRCYDRHSASVSTCSRSLYLASKQELCQQFAALRHVQVYQTVYIFLNGLTDNKLNWPEIVGIFSPRSGQRNLQVNIISSKT